MFLCEVTQLLNDRFRETHTKTVKEASGVELCRDVEVVHIRSCRLEKSPPRETQPLILSASFFIASFTHVHRALHSSLHHKPHFLEVQRGGPASARATHSALLQFDALSGEEGLHHKLNKTRKTLRVYSSWVQGRTKVKRCGRRESPLCFRISNRLNV